jgi:hypothetical protein
MSTTKLTLAALAVLGFSSAVAVAQPGFDRGRIERELHEFNDACRHGNNGACIRFGIILGEHPELRQEWRRAHPDYFWWEREPH